MPADAPLRADPDPYAAIAPYYDLEHDEFTDDLEVYWLLAKTAGGPILEGGCGSGRIAVALAQAGHQVIGLEPSAAMLERARRRATGLPEGRLRLIAGDLRDQPAGRSVSLAIVALNTWNHLTTAEDQRLAAQQLYGWLAPGGKLALDLAPPDLGLLTQPDDLLRLLWTGRDSATGEFVMKLESRRTDETRQVQQVTLLYDRIDQDEICRRRVTTFEQRYTSCSEITLLLEQSGFVIDNIYGSYDLYPYQAGSERLIVLASRPVQRARKRGRG